MTTIYAEYLNGAMEAIKTSEVSSRSVEKLKHRPFGSEFVTFYTIYRTVILGGESHSGRANEETFKLAPKASEQEDE